MCMALFEPWTKGSLISTYNVFKFPNQTIGTNRHRSLISTYNVFKSDKR